MKIRHLSEISALGMTVQDVGSNGFGERILPHNRCQRPLPQYRPVLAPNAVCLCDSVPDVSLCRTFSIQSDSQTDQDGYFFEAWVCWFQSESGGAEMPVAHPLQRVFSRRAAMQEHAAGLTARLSLCRGPFAWPTRGRRRMWPSTPPCRGPSPHSRDPELTRGVRVRRGSSSYSGGGGGPGPPPAPKNWTERHHKRLL